MDAVLVGDDGSDNARVAVEWATRFAAERASELFVVHVPVPGEDAVLARVGRTVVREGHPAAGIMSAAHDVDASAIVLGRRGRGGFRESSMGGVTFHVASASSLPVIVVPPADIADARPLVRKVVVGIDGMPETADAASWATRNLGEATFTAVHALEMAPAFAQIDRDPATDELYVAARTRTDELMRHHWCRPFVDAEVPFDTIIEEGGAVEVLLGVATRIAADLLIVSRRDRHLRRGTLGGVSQRVLAYSPCAAAMVPSPA
jgi:nucleotide-binding universal stress UspA family protein